MASSATELLRQKAALRRETQARLDAMSEEDVLRQSEDVAEQVLSSPEYERARSVALYLSMQQELRTERLVQHTLRSGRTLYVPRFRRGVPEMEMLIVHSEADLEAMPVNRWGIRQPADDDQRPSVFDQGSLDLVLAPGMAFTAAGERLGRGKGYYDRFLARCRAELERPPATLGLALAPQLVARVPTGPLDQMLDRVLVPAAAAKGAGRPSSPA